jgi:hypothetical protein
MVFPPVGNPFKYIKKLTIMDHIMQKLIPLSKQYRKTKNKFLDYSDTIKNTFNLSDEQISLVSFGIVETSNPSFQKYVDILNNDKTLNKLNDDLSKIKLEGIITILEYALKCREEISGYDLNILLKNHLENRNEIINLFEGLAGVNHIHLINDKIMLEIPSRNYITNNQRLLRYVDFWTKELEKFSA